MNINMVVTTLELNPMCSALFHVFAACASYMLPWVDSLLLAHLSWAHLKLPSVYYTLSRHCNKCHFLISIISLQPFFFFFLALLLLLLTSCKISRELFHISSARPSPAFFELKYTHAQWGEHKELSIAVSSAATSQKTQDILDKTSLFSQGDQ